MDRRACGSSRFWGPASIPWTQKETGSSSALSPERWPVTERRDVYIHPSSIVEEPCQIGPGTKIWHFCHVMSGAVIGGRCVLGQNTFVGKGVHIGAGVHIQNNVSIYEGVTLEDNVFCGPSCVFTNDINPRTEFPKHGVYLPTLVKRGASIGANATILCGHTVGRYAFIGAGAVVTKDVPDYALVVGMPARRVGWMCACGERLRVALDKATCAACGATYTRTHDGLAPEA
ncbi:MAG: N-acetyltransferase [Chloroflexi bacterium]|nr:N-acetyltransferase [Chloroflexota bacterium]